MIHHHYNRIDQTTCTMITHHYNYNVLKAQEYKYNVLIAQVQALPKAEGTSAANNTSNAKYQQQQIKGPGFQVSKYKVWKCTILVVLPLHSNLKLKGATNQKKQNKKGKQQVETKSSSAQRQAEIQLSRQKIKLLC